MVTVWWSGTQSLSCASLFSLNRMIYTWYIHGTVFLHILNVSRIAASWRLSRERWFCLMLSSIRPVRDRSMALQRCTQVSEGPDNLTICQFLREWLALYNAVYLCKAWASELKILTLKAHTCACIYEELFGNLTFFSLTISITWHSEGWKFPLLSNRWIMNGIC